MIINLSQRNLFGYATYENYPMMLSDLNSLLSFFSSENWCSSTSTCFDLADSCFVRTECHFQYLHEEYNCLIFFHLSTKIVFTIERRRKRIKCMFRTSMLNKIVVQLMFEYSCYWTWIKHCEAVITVQKNLF